MIEIHKPTHRLTRQQYGVLHHRKLRRIVVSLIPGDVLEFREQGGRHRFSMPVDTAFRMAIRMTVEAARRAKAEARRAKRGAA